MAARKAAQVVAESNFSGIDFNETHVGPQYGLAAFAEAHGGNMTMMKVKEHTGHIRYVANFGDGTDALLSDKLNKEIISAVANKSHLKLKASDVAIQKWVDPEDETRSGFSLFRKGGEETKDVSFM